MKISLHIILILFFCTSLVAQAPDTLWTKTYGVETNEIGSSAAQTSDGGYIVIGSTQHFSDGDFDIWLIKTDAVGDTLWTKAFGGTLNDVGYSVKQTSDGGYVIAGGTNSFGSGEQDMWLIKTNANGDTLWTKIFGGSEIDACFSILTIDDGYILTGHTRSFGNGAYDLLLIKTDLSGDTLWTKTIGGSGNDRGEFIQKTSAGGFIITGYTTSFGNGLTDIWLIKTDENGETLWSKTYGGSGSEQGYSVYQISDGYIISGYTNSFGAGGFDAWLIKSDENGDTLWTKTYGGSSNDLSYSGAITTDGFILTGFTHSFGEGLADLWVIKTDLNGDTLWTKTMGGGASEEGNGIFLTSDNSIIIVGETQSFGSGIADIWLVKLSSGTTSVEETQTQTQSLNDFHLDQNYPNPFNPSTKILFQVPLPGGVRGGFVSLKVYDVLGEEVATLVNEEKPAGSYEVEFNASGLTSGIYFYKLIAGNLVETKKMILLK